MNMTNIHGGIKKIYPNPSLIPELIIPDILVCFFPVFFFFFTVLQNIVKLILHVLIMPPQLKKT